VLVFANLFLVLVNQSETQLSFAAFTRIDRVTAGVYLTIFAIIGSIIYIPSVGAMAKMAALSLPQLGVAIALAMASTFWWDAVKMYRKCRGNSPD